MKYGMEICGSLRRFCILCKCMWLNGLFFFVLCHSQQTNCNQWVGVEIKHSRGSHHDERYLHERNKDAAEVAWCVWLNGFLHRLLIGCEVWVHDILHVKRFSEQESDFKVFFFWHQTHRPDKQRSWHLFPHCSWWPGSRSEHVHLSQPPVEMKSVKNTKRGDEQR